MTRRDLAVVIAALVIALGASALLFVGTMASEPAADAATARPRIFFDARNTPPPATRTIADVQQRVGPLAPIVPLQRNMSDTARDAAGFLLIIVITAATLLVAHERVVAAYRASLGGWRTQLRVVLTGLAVLGLGLSATALAWVVYLGYVATTARATPFAVPVALQIGLSAFAVIAIVLIAVLAIGFAAASWRLGDQLFRVRALSRYHADVPSPVVAIIGATLLYVAWQIPAIGAVFALLVVTYALGAVVTARLLSGGTPA